MLGAVPITGGAPVLVAATLLEAALGRLRVQEGRGRQQSQAEAQKPPGAQMPPGEQMPPLAQLAKAHVATNAWIYRPPPRTAEHVTIAATQVNHVTEDSA